MKRRKSVFFVALIPVFFILLLSVTVEARDPSATVNTFTPAIDSGPYITIYGSQTIQPRRYQFGGYFNYAKRPLELGIGGATRTGIVNHLIDGDFFGALGITDWMEVGLNIPVIFLESITAPTAAIPGNVAGGENQKVLKMGDVSLESKIRLLDIDRHNFGIALVPEYYAPTGSGSFLVGNNGFGALGAKVVTDINIKNRIQMALNLGYLSRRNVTILGTRQDDSFTYGVGANIKAMDWLDIIGETHGSTNVANLFNKQSESPLEVDGGLRFALPVPEGMAITVGGGAGLTFGYGAPVARGLIALTYPNPQHVELPVEPPPPPPPPEPAAKVEKEKIVITKKVHFEFDKAVIRPISFSILDAVVDILKSNSDIHKVQIEGHCDSKGSEAYNNRLSQRRANAVKEYLTSHGVSANRLKTVGYGKSKPIATNDTPEGRARNRRVEFTIMEEGSSESRPASSKE